MFGLKLSTLDVWVGLFFPYINQNGSIISKIEARKKKKKDTVLQWENIIFKNSNIPLVFNSREHILVREVAVARPVKICSNVVTLPMSANLWEVLDTGFNAGFHWRALSSCKERKVRCLCCLCHSPGWRSGSTESGTRLIHTPAGKNCWKEEK